MPNTIFTAIADLGAYVTGLRVLYRGYGMSLYPPTEDDGRWEAHANPDAEDDFGYPAEMVGRGATPMDAMQGCATLCEQAEARA